jgi:hypothetical protein
VIEPKDSPSLSKRAMVAELRGDMANRDAKAGVLVFARQDQTPDKLIFQTMGYMAIVACEDGDTMALELAYQWARWVTCREAPTPKERPDGRGGGRPRHHPSSWGLGPDLRVGG